MFSFLDGVNQFLNFIAIEPKTRNRIYTFLGIIAEAYVLYVGVKFLMNASYLYGLGILAIAILMGYFLYLNVIYYFTNSVSRFDITPFINRKLHIKPKSSSKKREFASSTSPSNGVFDDRKTMPAVMQTDAEEQRNINDLAAALIAAGLVKPDYSGFDDNEIKIGIKRQRHHRMFAIGKGILIPYFTMSEDDGRYEVYAGINAADYVSVGHITRVGFQSVKDLNKDEITLFLADAYLVGGPYKTLGRSEVVTKNDNYGIQIRIAYEKK